MCLDVPQSSGTIPQRQNHMKSRLNFIRDLEKDSHIFLGRDNKRLVIIDPDTPLSINDLAPNSYSWSWIDVNYEFEVLQSQ